MYCDAFKGECRCSASVRACKLPEICDHSNGVCNCGSSPTCADKSIGSHCDPVNSQCKCAEDVDSCNEGQTCSLGKCVGRNY